MTGVISFYEGVAFQRDDGPTLSMDAGRTAAATPPTPLANIQITPGARQERLHQAWLEPPNRRRVCVTAGPDHEPVVKTRNYFAKKYHLSQESNLDLLLTGQASYPFDYRGM
ncbi:hypothetical protein P5V15_014095 [Pogonomyrmex californicus]